MIFWILLGVTVVWGALYLLNKVQPWPWSGILILAWIVGLFAWFGAGDLKVDHYGFRKDLLLLKDSVHRESHGSGGGAFVLMIGVGGGSSSSGPEWTYTWYERDSEGAVRLRTHDADSDEVAIFEDAKPGHAYLIERWTHTTEEADTVIAPFASHMDFHIGDEYERTELHVPPGTVERSLQLDGE